MLERTEIVQNAPNDCSWQIRVLGDEVAATKTQMANQANLQSVIDYANVKKSTKGGGAVGISSSGLNLGAQVSVGSEQERFSAEAYSNNYIVAVTECRVDNFYLAALTSDTWNATVTATCMFNIWDPNIPTDDNQSEHRCVI